MRPIVTVVVALAACTPQWLVREVARAHPGCLYSVATGENVVALTIDDGPDSSTTPEILRVLADNGARATFFLIGSRVRGNEALVARLASAGHEIGNHSAGSTPSVLLTEHAFERSLVSTDSLLRRFGPVTWARPSSGFYNRQMIETLGQKGYKCALGSVYPFDPQLPFATRSARMILRHVRPGAIIILHDGGYRGRNTARALRHVLPELRRRGYRITTLTELTRTPRDALLRSPMDRTSAQ